IAADADEIDVLGGRRGRVLDQVSARFRAVREPQPAGDGAVVTREHHAVPERAEDVYVAVHTILAEVRDPARARVRAVAHPQLLAVRRIDAGIVLVERGKEREAVGDHEVFRLNGSVMQDAEADRRTAAAARRRDRDLHGVRVVLALVVHHREAEAEFLRLVGRRGRGEARPAGEVILENDLCTLGLLPVPHDDHAVVVEAARAIQGHARAAADHLVLAGDRRRRAWLLLLARRAAASRHRKCAEQADGQQRDKTLEAVHEITLALHKTTTRRESYPWRQNGASLKWGMPRKEE